MSIQVSTRIDEATKRQFDNICERIGVSPSNALSIFIKSVINFNGIPFSIVAPSAAAIQNKKMSRSEVFGCMRGQFKMAEDFNAPLEDFKEYM